MQCLAMNQVVADQTAQHEHEVAIGHRARHDIAQPEPVGVVNPISPDALHRIILRLTAPDGEQVLVLTSP